VSHKLAIGESALSQKSIDEPRSLSDDRPRRGVDR
jgi:hypothetical protein